MREIRIKHRKIYIYMRTQMEIRVLLILVSDVDDKSDIRCLLYIFITAFIIRYMMEIMDNGTNLYHNKR